MSRTFAEDGYRLRAACLCLNAAGSHVLLVSSSRHPDKLVLPGGGVDPGESYATAALREAREEAGVATTASLEPPFLCVRDHVKKLTRTHLYLVRECTLLTDYDEAWIRRRVWVPLVDAHTALDGKKHQQELLADGVLAMRALR